MFYDSLKAGNVNFENLAYLDLIDTKNPLSEFKAHTKFYENLTSPGGADSILGAVSQQIQRWNQLTPKNVRFYETLQRGSAGK